ncbi:hypothetical protein L3X38_005787 [Prunus dulcis]|uniref:Uncharacterized protein n=1 Tax=Prunus dulcis TaxID=3755 RepID=A0AAD5F4J5_PRUDU|nr:hypothetical protein L3X38_005787 [Prunus dulcis]
MAVERDPLICHGIKANQTELIPETKKFPFRFLPLVAIPCPANPSYQLRPPKISGIFRKINGPDFWLADSSEIEIAGDRYHGDFESGDGRKISKEIFGFFHGKVTETESGGEGQLFLKWERESCCFVYHQIEKVHA